MEAFNGKIRDFSQLFSVLVGMKFVFNEYFWRGKRFSKQNKTKTDLADESRSWWRKIHLLGQVTSHSEATRKGEVPYRVRFTATSCLQVSLTAYLGSVPVPITS